MARTKGATDYKTREYKEKLSAILETTIEQIQKGDDIAKLTPRDRVELLTKLVQYFVPKPVEGAEQTEQHQKNMEMILASIAGKNK